MFESFLSQFTYRPVGQKVAIVVGALLAIGSLVVGAVVFSGEPGGPEGAKVQTAASITEKPAKHQMFGVVYDTYSDRNQTVLLDNRLYGLATAAMRENAQLTLYVGDDAPEVHQNLLLSRTLARKTDNPEEVLPVEELDAIKQQAHDKLEDLPAAPMTSVTGSLRLLAARFDSARRSKADLVVGWIVGDSISTVKNCNFYVADMSPAAVDYTARQCLGASPINLGGAEVRLVGVGQDLSGATDPSVSVGTVAVVSRMIELSNGRPTIAYLDGGPTGVGFGG